MMRRKIGWGFALLLLANNVLAQQLIFAIDIIRHGDRSPTVEMPASPYPWYQGLGQLTPEGLNQEYQLGITFRQLYINKYHLLPSNYQQSTIYVRSTDFDRTLMSAASALYALYPLGTGPHLTHSSAFALPMGYQPIPIHTRLKHKDRLLIADNADPLQYKHLVQKYVYSSPTWQKVQTQLSPNFARWSQLSGC